MGVRRQGNRIVNRCERALHVQRPPSGTDDKQVPPGAKLDIAEQEREQTGVDQNIHLALAPGRKPQDDRSLTHDRGLHEADDLHRFDAGIRALIRRDRDRRLDFGGGGMNQEAFFVDDPGFAEIGVGIDDLAQQFL